ncbi:MAG: hypothetical protein ACI31M_01765 [Bacilli bacterium]
MDANKVLNKQIFKEVFIAFIFLGIVLIGGYAIYSAVKGNKILTDDDLILDVNSKEVANNLYIMGDSAGLNTKPYVLNITNNSKKKADYSLILKNGINSNVKVEDYLRVAVDDNVIKNLKDFKMDKKGNYILLTEEIDKGYTKIHTVRIWFNSESPNVLSGSSSAISFIVTGE